MGTACSVDDASSSHNSSAQQTVPPTILDVPLATLMLDDHIRAQPNVVTAYRTQPRDAFERSSSSVSSSVCGRRCADDARSNSAMLGSTQSSQRAAQQLMVANDLVSPWQHIAPSSVRTGGGIRALGTISQQSLRSNAPSTKLRGPSSSTWSDDSGRTLTQFAPYDHYGHPVTSAAAALNEPMWALPKFRSEGGPLTC